MHNVTALIIFKVMANMMTGEDYKLLECVLNKLKLLDYTCSVVVLDCERSES
ncbi:hypothetical protein [Holdemanella biformis]|uniref:hypothetical protein n=1 Tax=Holdemanella biformis TaxID=1735 RepID=UPI002E780AE4|nr:hypothetical protein [Holdemanella biformis]